MIKSVRGFAKDLLPKTSVAFDRAAGSISNITGLLNQHELSVVELKTLDNLVHQTLGIINSATPGNPTAVAEGGTAIFRVQKLLQFNEYTAANRNDAGKTPKSEIKVKISISHSEACKYELETLDLPGLGFGTREQFVSYVAAGVNKSMTALLDAHYVDIFVADLKAKQTAWLAANTGKTFADFVAAHPEQVIYNADFADLAHGATDAATMDYKLKTAYRQAARARINIARQLTQYDLGARKADFATFLHDAVISDLLIAMPKGGNDATTLGRELTGVEGTSVVAGLGLVKDHLYFGKSIPKGTSFSEDKDFDFSKVYGLIAHQEAAFLAVQGLQTSAAIDPNSGNQKYIVKFNLFKGIVRDTLYGLFVNGEL